MNSALLPEFDSVDEVQAWLLSALLRDGEAVSPRGMETRELTGIAFRLRNPRRRCISSPARKFHLPLAIGEFAWHMRADDDVAGLAYYAKRWRDFAEDGHRITGSCYGSKIFRARGEIASQWTRLKKVLHDDPFSRRAVLLLWDDSGLDSGALDVPCTSTIQFLIRNSRVHAVVAMRSNDTIWGVPYDVFLFTMLQEYLACELGLDVGEYTHFASSMHLYQRHYDLASKILAEPLASFEMPAMSDPWQLDAFLLCEREIRENLSSAPETLALLDRYWGALGEVLLWYRDRRRGASPCSVDASPYRPFLRSADSTAAKVA